MWTDTCTHKQQLKQLSQAANRCQQHALASELARTRCCCGPPWLLAAPARAAAQRGHQIWTRSRLLSKFQIRATNSDALHNHQSVLDPETVCWL